MRRVFVTGADGFIGSHLTETLVKRGFDVRAFVLYNPFGAWGWLDTLDADVKASLEVVAGDVRDAHALKEAMRGCDTVMHLAALIAIPYSYQAPETYLDTNARGTLNVLQAARELSMRVVHTSTSEVYGSAQYVPIDEAHPLSAQSPYAASKIAADQLALSFQRSFDLPVVTVRPFNTYGPRQSARAVIPTVISQIAAGKRRIELGALTPTRNFNFVRDTVAGFIAAGTADTDVSGEVINLGSDFEVSIGETVELIAEVMNASVEVVCAQDRLRPARSEVTRLSADARKAAQLLSWTPDYAGRAGLKRGLLETAQWLTQADNLKGYRVDHYTL